MRYFDFLNELRFVQILQYFEDSKMVDHILKISRPRFRYQIYEILQ